MKKKSLKKEEAQSRKEAYNKLNIQQKIDALDMKFGKGRGAVRQRKRLERMLNEKKNN